MKEKSTEGYKIQLSSSETHLGWKYLKNKRVLRESVLYTYPALLLPKHPFMATGGDRLLATKG